MKLCLNCNKPKNQHYWHPLDTTYKWYYTDQIYCVDGDWSKVWKDK